MRRKILVTGGGGFLGKAIVARLLKKGYSVRSFARGAYPELAAQGVEVVRGEISRLEDVMAATAGCSAIFHVAAKAGVWGDYRSYHRTNVLGTQNILAAQQAHQIPHFIYTSTPSVTFSGLDQDGVDESAPYAAHFYNHYQRTKATAESLVLKANSPELKTVALRPHLIWGPGDTQLVPRVVELQKAGRLRLVDGGLKLVDAVYIDNAAHAHCLAFEALMRSGSPVAGKAYFVTNHEPWPIGQVINGILAAAGLSAADKVISSRVALALGTCLEGVYKVLRLTKEPPMTRFVALQLSTSHWYQSRRAKEDLGYVPLVSMAEGMKNLRAALQPQAERH